MTLDALLQLLTRLMPVDLAWFRHGPARPRGGHLGGNRRPAPAPLSARMRFPITFRDGNAALPWHLEAPPKRDRDRRALATGAEGPMRGLIQRNTTALAEGRSRCACRRHRRERIIDLNNQDGGSARVRWPQSGGGITMSEKIYDVPADWAKRAWVDHAKYRDMYARSISDPNGFWTEQAKRVGWIKPFTKVENTSYRARPYLDQMVRGRRAQRRLELHRPASGKARRPDRDHLGGRRSLRVQAHHLSAAARRGLQVRQYPAHPQCRRRATASPSTCR